MDKNQIQGGVMQGEWAVNREAFVTKVSRRKSGGCAMKECVLTWGDLASCLKGRRGNLEREVSKGRSSWQKPNQAERTKGRTRGSVLARC